MLDVIFKKCFIFNRAYDLKIEFINQYNKKLMISSDDEEYGEHENVLIGKSEVVSSDLPLLFNSSSRRKKTIDNYIAPISLRNNVYMCKEFPQGVFINKYGEVCPEDPRSNVYKIVDDKSDIKVELSDGSDCDYENEEDCEEYDEDEEEEYDDDDDDDYDEEEGEIFSDEDDDYKPRKRTKVASKSLKSLNDSKAIIDSFQSLVESKKTYITQLKLKDYTQALVKKWKKIPKNVFKMKFESNLFVTNPTFHFEFNKKGQNSVNVILNCATKHLTCDCDFECVNVNEMHQHLVTDH
jgi:hypothetical protein